MNDNDTEQLIKRVRKGDIDAFEELMRLHLPAVRSFIAYYLPVEHCVDEICHESFIIAFNKIADFKKGSFRAWLITIARFQTMKEIERFKRMKRNKENFTAQLLIDYEPGEQKIRNEQIHLDTCLLRLKDDQRQLIDLAYRDGLQSGDIAVTLNKSRSWVRTTLMRLRVKLKECIENQELT